ncbi:MAG: extracellular solute-binding protein, partial [Candidatus Asgardarchaeia archaeon]
TDKKKITFDSPEAVKAVQLMKDIYWKYKIVPPQVTSWDEYANNLYFQNKTVAMVINGNSIVPRLLKENPDVVPQVGMSIPPAGPATRGAIAIPMTWTIFKTKNADISKKLVLYFLNKETQLQLLKKMGKTGFYGPMRLDVLTDPYFEKLPMTIRMCMETAKYEVGPAYPYPTTPEAIVAYNSGIYVDIPVRVAVDNWSAEKAVKEAAEKIKEIIEH